jgi:hypothetical protein
MRRVLQSSGREADGGDGRACGVTGTHGSPQHEKSRPLRAVTQIGHALVGPLTIPWRWE